MFPFSHKNLNFPITLSLFMYNNKEIVKLINGLAKKLVMLLMNSQKSSNFQVIENLINYFIKKLTPIPAMHSWSSADCCLLMAYKFTMAKIRIFPTPIV